MIFPGSMFRLPLFFIIISSALLTSSLRVRIPSSSSPHAHSLLRFKTRLHNGGLAADDLTIALAARANELTDMLSKKDVTSLLLEKWEVRLDELVSEVKRIKDKDIIFGVYAQLLRKNAPLELDLLQLNVFDRISGAAMDALIKLQPPDAPITAVADELTDVHLDYLEVFRRVLDEKGNEDESSSGFSQAGRQEFLCYQFATLVHLTYGRLSRGLGEDFDNSAGTQEMRISNWESPVHARLQRRFVRFLASNVVEKSEEIFAAAFEGLLTRVRVELPSPYRLLEESNAPISTSSSSAMTGGKKEYPAWTLSQFLTRLLRNTATYVDPAALMPKISRRIQEELSPAMGKVGAPVERLATRSVFSLNDKERSNAETLLNLGHATVAGALALWQIGSNIVGKYDETEDKWVKDFIKPLVLGGDATSLEGSLPASIRLESVEAAKDLKEEFDGVDAQLEGFSVLAHAIRMTVAEDFRALITYSTDAAALPASRDSCFSALLQLLLTSAITASELNERHLYENLVAMAALEEALGTREPRKSVREGLRQTVRVVSAMESPPADLQSRLKIVEKALGMILRLPSGEGRAIRSDAFRAAVEDTLASGASPKLRERCMLVAQSLEIDLKTADSYLTGLLRSRFDRFVGQTLLNAETALSMPELGSVFVAQVTDVAEQCGLPLPEAQDRVVLLAAAVLVTLFEGVVEESKRRDVEKAEAMLKRASLICKHPIVLPGLRPGSTLQEIAIKMVSSQVKDPARLLVLVRALEGVRQRVAGVKQDEKQLQQSWSEGEGRLDAELAAFVQQLQAALLKEHSTATMKKAMGGG